LAIVLFFPVLLCDPEFLSLASASALLLMGVLECLRVTNVPLLGKMLHEVMDRYRDEKDPGELLTTHMYARVLSLTSRRQCVCVSSLSSHCECICVPCLFSRRQFVYVSSLSLFTPRMRMRVLSLFTL
jgi:hypothetical protein